jgi:hypothetical protein
MEVRTPTTPRRATASAAAGSSTSRPSFAGYASRDCSQVSMLMSFEQGLRSTFAIALGSGWIIAADGIGQTPEQGVKQKPLAAVVCHRWSEKVCPRAIVPSEAGAPCAWHETHYAPFGIFAVVWAARARAE